MIQSTRISTRLGIKFDEIATWLLNQNQTYAQIGGKEDKWMLKPTNTAHNCIAYLHVIYHNLEQMLSLLWTNKIAPQQLLEATRNQHAHRITVWILLKMNPKLIILVMSRSKTFCFEPEISNDRRRMCDVPWPSCFSLSGTTGVSIVRKFKF